MLCIISYNKRVERKWEMPLCTRTAKDVTMAMLMLEVVVRYCICGEEEAQGSIVEIKPTYLHINCIAIFGCSSDLSWRGGVVWFPDSG